MNREIFKKANELSRIKLKAYSSKAETYSFDGVEYQFTQADKNYAQFRTYDFIIIVFFIYTLIVTIVKIQFTWQRMIVLVIICIIVRIVILLADVRIYQKTNSLNH